VISVFLIRISVPVKKVIWEAVRWTVMLSIISIILTYLIAIPLGIKSASQKDSTADKAVSTTLFMLYSLPVFLGSYLTNHVFSVEATSWVGFPAYGVGEVFRF
jgi:peptide/nickel transport system permease protein